MHVVAQVTRTPDHWWAITVPEIDGLLTQARTLADVPRQVIDAAALLGLAVDDVTVIEQDDAERRARVRAVMNQITERDAELLRRLAE